MTLRPSREEFRALARDHTVIPVWREVLADFTTPVSAFARLVGDDDGFLLESVEHGERWSRWSFIGRNPLATLTSRGRPGRGRRRAARRACRSTRGSSPPSSTCSTVWKAPQLDDLPPLHGGIMGYLGYDVVREVEHLPDVPPDDQGHPDAMVSVIGQLAAYDHWRQRATLIENVLVEPGLADDELDRRYDDAVARLDELAADGARPLDEPLLDPPDPDDPLPDVRSVMGADGVLPGRGGGQGAHPRRRHLPGRPGAAVRPRPRRRTPSTCTGCSAR